MKISRPACAAAWVGAAMAAPSAWAGDLNSLQLLTQSEFRLLSQDLGAALSYKPLLPSAALGITGFDIGAAVTVTALKSVVQLERATNNTDLPESVPVPSLRAHKGLPFNIDLGVVYSALPSTNIKVVGGELRWAILPGSVALPAVAVRASLTKLTGVDQLKLDTQGLDISVSKGFAIATPYIGAGIVRVKSTPQGVPALRAESFSQSKVFGGLNLNFGLVNLALEADTTDSRTSYGIKFGFRF